MAGMKGVRLNRRQEDAVEDMVESGKADNSSEAMRMVINAGMRQYGYQNGGNGETTLKWATKEGARACVWIGIAWLALTLYFPIGLRMWAVFWFFAAAGFSGGYAVLDQYEPRVTRRLRGLFGGERA